MGIEMLLLEILHIAMTLSLADSSNSGIPIILVNAEGLVEAELPALARATHPKKRNNEILVAAETDC